MVRGTPTSRLLCDLVSKANTLHFAKIINSLKLWSLVDLRITHKTVTRHCAHRNHFLRCCSNLVVILKQAPMALTTPAAGTVYSPPSSAQPPPPSTAGQAAAAAAATLRCLSATPHLQHPQSSNGGGCGGYRAYSAMIHYCSAGYSPCDSMALPPPTPLPLLTPPSSAPLR